MTTGAEPQDRLDDDDPPGEDASKDEGGDYVLFEETSYCCLGSHLTYQGAIDLAGTFGLNGRIIGFRGSNE